MTHQTGFWQTKAALAVLSVLLAVGTSFAVPVDKVLTININPPGAGTATGAGNYIHNTTATATAFSNPGCGFTGWTGAITTTDNPASVQMNQDKVITANFSDNAPPEITQCADNQTVPCGIVPDFTGDVTATDNITAPENLVITQDPVAGSNASAGDTTVTITVADQAGNTDTCTATLTVQDVTPPEITQCAGDQAVGADALCQGTVPDLTAGVIATDDCVNVDISQDPAAGTLVGLGDTTVTITAMDNAGNMDTCTATLTVEDTTPPEITVCAPGDGAVADGNCEAMVPDFTGAVAATDNCDIAPVITQDPVAGTVVGLGVTAVTITVTDAAGNAETCVANFTVNEDVPPTGTILINNNLSVTNSPDVTLNLTWDDGECASGVVRMRFSDDGRTWSVWEPLLASKPYTLPGPDGYNTVRVQYRDRANNVSERYNDFIRLDTVAPTGTILINNNAWRTFNRNVVLNLTWDDTDGSGVVRMRFSQDGKTWTAWEPLSATKAITLTGPIGYNTVRVQYRDAAGNNSDRFNDYILLAE
ncbi:MAG: HYR domain-containing protein [Candidatus Hydrogenedentes bacterium]|nr:HYR domain-containing protein [Candidatus Hydrogenedentota bacterium]